MDRDISLHRLNRFRSLLRVFIGQFLLMLIRGIGYAAILMVVTLVAVFKGIWDQSGTIARTWQNHTRIDDRFSTGLFWAIRFIAIWLMLNCLVLLLRLFEWVAGLW
jgi:hypothetical protein